MSQAASRSQPAGASQWMEQQPRDDAAATRGGGLIAAEPREVQNEMHYRQMYLGLVGGARRPLVGLEWLLDQLLL